MKPLELEIASELQQYELDTTTALKNAQEDRRDLNREAWIEFAKWLAPATFAGLLAWWMVQFFKAGNAEAAKSIRELLLLMIGGALGWIARKA